LVGLGVVADGAHHGDVGREGEEVAGDVGGAAGVELVAFDLDDRNRGLGRDTADAAPEEAVEHDVAHDEDSLVSELLKGVSEAVSVHGLRL
jgi:hypothetical protein